MAVPEDLKLHVPGLEDTPLEVDTRVPERRLGLHLGSIELLGEAAAKIEGVRRVISLPGIKKAVDVSGNWSMEKFSAVVTEIDFFQNNLFSSDGKTTALTLLLKSEADSQTVIQHVRQLIAETSQELADSLVDPLGTMYRFGLPASMLKRSACTERDQA